jgi:hypothetical protein
LIPSFAKGRRRRIGAETPRSRKRNSPGGDAATSIAPLHLSEDPLCVLKLERMKQSDGLVELLAEFGIA